MSGSDRQMSGWQMSGSVDDQIQSANVRSPNVMVSICPFGKWGSANVNRQKSAPTTSARRTIRNAAAAAEEERKGELVCVEQNGFFSPWIWGQFSSISSDKSG